MRNAPTLVIVYADKKNFGITTWDAGIATYAINLAAETLGIGTLMNGFLKITADISETVRKAIHLPKGVRVMAAVCLGYPTIKYRRTVDRNPLEITKFPAEKN